MNLPTIKFVELQDKTEEALIKYLYEHCGEGDALVYLRQRYTEQHEWEYLIAACCFGVGTFGEQVVWLMDWYEGQPFVEYLAVTQIIEE